MDERGEGLREERDNHEDERNCTLEFRAVRHGIIQKWKWNE
jgi:hypothetical protein